MSTLTIKIIFKKLNFKSFLYIVVFLIFLFYSNIFTHSVIECQPLLKDVSFFKSHIINGSALYYSGDLTYAAANDFVKYINYHQFNSLNWSFYKPTNISIQTFPYKHPYRHYNLNILTYNNLIENYYVNIQMSTHNFNNCYLLSEKNISNIYKKQYIANNFYLYPKNEFEKYLYNFNDDKTTLYINNYKDDINQHIINVKDKYKI